MGTTSDKLNYLSTNLKGTGGILPTLQAKGVISDAGASLAAIKAAVAAYAPGNDPEPPYFTGNYQRLRRGINVDGRDSVVTFAISAPMIGTPTVTVLSQDSGSGSDFVDTDSLWWQEDDVDEFGVNVWACEISTTSESPAYNGDIAIFIDFEYDTGQRAEVCHVFHYST